MKTAKPILIFDYDGTLHETMALYKSAVCDAVRWLSAEKETFLSAASVKRLERFKESPEEDALKRWIGMNPGSMWDDFLPGMPEDLKQCAIRRVGKHMEQRIAEDGRWYPGVESMLDTFKELGYSMIVLSNCTESYAHSHWRQFDMQRWFSAFLACESYENRPKEQIVSALLENPEETIKWAAEVQGAEKLCLRIRNRQGNPPFVIGDRASDCKAAVHNRLPFVGCLYGYGEEKELHPSCGLAGAPAEIVPIVQKAV